MERQQASGLIKQNYNDGVFFSLTGSINTEHINIQVFVLFFF